MTVHNYFERPRLVAGGTIYPARFIELDITADNTAIAATAGASRLIGVTTEATREAPIPEATSPTPAANAGEPVEFYRLGENGAKIELGGTVTRGDWVQPKSDGSGKGVKAASGMGAGWALQSGVSGEKVDLFLFGSPQKVPGSVGATASVTATTDGLTTGLIPDFVDVVDVTSDDANKIITLPEAVVGKQIIINVAGATGCELRTPATSNVKINDVDSDGSQEAALPADQHYLVRAVSTTEWILVAFSKLGVVNPTAAIVPD